ncbi:hypothetical protein JCGZ_13575 [Jatropha curcas]|uniref:Aminotransferase-like plant mobile domain-containing protein n=1 Tax=Jatropha curcas TaxID=180498 RepID=A0A067KDN7_JATCU|nr:hypothetical protein JCGZ_13575 [Jatropha curcas]
MMSQISEIPASAYTREMETPGALPDIPTFDGEPMPVSQNPLTLRTRPMQLLPLPGTEFPNKGDPEVLACLRDLSQVGSFDWATLGLAHLYHGLDVWTRGSGESNWLFIQPLEVWSYEYCIYPGGPSDDSPVESKRIPRYLAHCHHTYASGEILSTGGASLMTGSCPTPAGVVLGDVPFPPGMEVVLDPGLGLGSGIIIPTDLQQAPPPVQLDPEHTTHDLEIGRLRFVD